MPVATQYVIVCTVAADGVGVAPCGVIDGVGYIPSVVPQPVLSVSTVEAFEAALGPIDPAEMATFWAFPIIGVLGIWLLGFGVGSLLKTVGDA